jgi:Fe-S cluster biogenesis protein NfuA
VALFSRNRKPEAPPESSGPLFEAVRDAMAEVRSYAQSHGGNIELLSVTEAGVVTIRFAGACKGCPLSGITLKLGIEEQLRIRVPGVKKVLAG